MASKVKNFIFYFFKFFLLVFLFFELLTTVVHFFVLISESKFFVAIFSFILNVLLIFVLVRIFKRLSNRYIFAAGFLVLSLFLYTGIYRFITVTGWKLERTDLNNLLIYLSFIVIAFLLQKFADLEEKRKIDNIQPQLDKEIIFQMKEEIIMGKILGIRMSGTRAMAYWNIVVTNQAVYFLQAGANYIPFFWSGIGSVMIDAFYTRVAKKKGERQNLSYFLSKAIKTIRLEKNQLDYINFEKGVFKKKVSLQTAEKIYKFKLSSKHYNLLQSLIEGLKSSI